VYELGDNAHRDLPGGDCADFQPYRGTDAPERSGRDAARNKPLEHGRDFFLLPIIPM